MSTALIQSRLPPGPKGTIIGGNIRQFRAGLLSFLLDTAREYGPLASFRIGPKRVFLASGPDLIEQVLVTDAKHYIKHFGARAFKPVLGNGLVTSEGAFWLRQRKLIQPAFSKARVQSYASAMIELTNEMLDSWTEGKSVEIDLEFEALTSKIALKTLFDLDDPGDRERFSDTLRLAFNLMNERLRRIVKIPFWVPTRANRRLQQAVAELNQTVEGFIAAGRSRSRPGDDLLSRLLFAQHEDGTRMSDRQLSRRGNDALSRWPRDNSPDVGLDLVPAFAASPCRREAGVGVAARSRECHTNYAAPAETDIHLCCHR